MTEPIPIAESLAGVVRALRSDTNDRSSATTAGAMGSVFGRWDEVVGPTIAAHVQPVRLDGTRLIVNVDDPAWVTHVRFLEADLLRRLTDDVGSVVDALEVRVARP